MEKSYVNFFRGENYYPSNEKFRVKEEPVSPRQDDFYFMDDFDFASCAGMKKSLSMNDITALKEELAKPDAQCMKEEPRYRRPTGSSTQDLSRAKFVSLAESVYHYQRDTPGRFHSTRPQVFRSQCNAGPTGLTVPQSPMLRCKGRSRPVHVMSLKEREEMLIEEMKNFKIRANPIPKAVLYGPSLPDVPKKSATIPEPFKLTEVQKKTLPQSPLAVQNFKARPAPKYILEKPQLPPKLPIECTKPITLRLNCKRADSAERFRCDKNINKFAKESENKQTCKSAHREGPIRPEPFSFEKRDEEIKKRKEERIKQQLEEEKRLASLFKAQPLPAVVKKQMQHATSKSSVSNASSENKENCNRFEARPPDVLYKKPFKPVLQSIQVITPEPFELITEKRATEREKFEQMLREKEEQREKMRLQMEKEQREAEERAQAELRAKLIHHAKPVPKLTPFMPQKCTDAMTVPVTPNLMKRKQRK
ncbi:targeting protein for Xklp2 homolog [Papilio machaon]|uniref:targeting protein for Xklp2 homolog n=1 Tax=Papilio machaon TaxID=76193 RepID=UPI001E665DD4|nr:targeting protein for Xklp2 homolog [Papilio machaon]